MRMSRRDLYALGEPFGYSSTQVKAGSKDKTYGDGGDGGSSAPTQTTVQNTNLPDYVQPYVMSMLGAAQNQMFNMDSSGNITGFKPYVPYSSNPANYVASFSPLQQQAQAAAGNLTLPGQFNTATNAANAAINQAANASYNPLVSNYMTTSAPMLQNYGMRGPANVSATGVTAPTMQAAQTGYNPSLTNYQMGPASQVTTQDFTQPGIASQYMSPYIKQALDPQLAEIRRQYGITGTQQQSAATGAGAFGGSREALMASENARNMNTALNQAIGQGYQNAFTNAQQQFNAQQQANLAAQQANQQAGLTTGAQNLAANLGVQQLSTQTGLQAQLANLSNAQQAAVQNQAAQLQAAGMNASQALQAALANQQMQYNTGAQNLAAQLGIQQLGAGQNLQSQLANQQAYQSAQQLAANQQQFGANYGLQNLQALLSGATQLGNLGTSQLAAQQGIINAQNTAGAQQQAQQQQIINQAIQNYAQQQQMPLQSLSNLSALLHGLPLQNTTTQSYQAAPSTISQIAGLGTGVAGLSKLAAKGGSVKDIKKMAGGGIASLENRQRIAENYPPNILKQEVQRGVLPPGTGTDLAQDYTNLQKAAEGMKAQQAAAQIAAGPGVSSLPSNLPVQGMAKGGIIAFDEGGDTSSVVKKTKTTTGNPYGFSWDYQPQALSTAMTDQEIGQYNNPNTGKPYTPDEFTKMMNERRKGYGISDIYTAQTEDVKARKAKVEDAREQAKGLALLAAAGKMLGSTSPYWGVGVGAGVGEYATNYGSAAEKLDARDEALAKENNEIARAQMAMKQAWMNQDTTEFNHEQDNLNKALTAKQGILNQNTAAVNQGNLEKNKELNSYNEKIRAQEISSASAHNTDLRWLASVNYQDLVKNKGMPANESTAALAAKLATEQIGLAGAKLTQTTNAAQTTADIALQGKVNDALKSDPLVGDKGSLRIDLLTTKDDPKANAKVQKEIEQRIKEVTNRVKSENPHLVTQPLASGTNTQATPNVIDFSKLPTGKS